MLILLPSCSTIPVTSATPVPSATFVPIASSVSNNGSAVVSIPTFSFLGSVLTGLLISSVVSVSVSIGGLKNEAVPSLTNCAL